MSNTATDLNELLNCIKQFETDIGTTNETAENWRQSSAIYERKTLKVAKVKHKLHRATQEAELEVSRLREEVQNAEKDYQNVDKQVASCSARIEAAEYEGTEIEKENNDFEKILFMAEKNLVECIVKAKIEAYIQAVEGKMRIDAKLRQLSSDGDDLRISGVPTVQNNTLSGCHTDQNATSMDASRSAASVSPKHDILSDSHHIDSMEVE